VLRPVRQRSAAAAGIGDEREAIAPHSLRVEMTPWTLGVEWTF